MEEEPKKLTEEEFEKELAKNKVIEAVLLNALAQQCLEMDEIKDKGWVQVVHTLSIDTDGGKQKMRCADVEGIFRIIQSLSYRKILTIAGKSRFLILQIHYQ
jgi:hypothetical protein